MQREEKMKKRLVILAAFLFAFSFPVYAAEIAAESSITSVIVYPDRARVSRTALVEMDPGEHVLIFQNLPPNLDLDSIQVGGEGRSGLSFFATETRRVILEQPRAEEIARLEAEIEDVRDQIAGTQARLEDLQAEDKLVHDIGVYTGEQFSKEFITCEPQPEEWAAMVEFQRQNLARISEEILHVHVQSRELNRRLDALLRQIEELQGQAARERLDVRVSLSAAEAGRFNLSLSYVITGAGWYPTYEARADIPQERVQFAAIGNVRQRTGEDWKDVSLSLSTARPAIGAQAPELPPWILRPRPPVLEAAPSMERGAGLFDRELQMQKDEARPIEARIVPRETSVQFEIPYKLDIPSDNAYHRAAIFSEILPAEFSYTAVPKLSPHAYLTGKIKNATGAYWLPGKTTVFVEGDMAGSLYIEPVAPNEEVTLGFGTDEALTVEREELVRKEDESRVFGTRKEHYFKNKITVTNHKKKAVTLELVDQVPASQHEDIRITGIEFSVKPSEFNRDTGIVKWNLSLGPGEKREIIIEFTVVHPLDMDVLGLLQSPLLR
ncbi:MAG: mucoidy inhibitor MuiA family protein [Candidatus Abyssobacteria bacterium SURF_5]|uniref:Mucoidy inhibitor MuiA family protein n=1 Tax=Abyssobacteria bacterium (strain SURF_5) TaxID=2093360 RepID=A0A3A4N8B8_ABYX5|nr:MAG: mucoidy inhibitor MuiA family protein [Candidatus Abyssubacteria bacterium SURF_5]